MTAVFITLSVVCSTLLFIFFKIFSIFRLDTPKALVINYLIAANYIYLCTPPIASNPLILGPWPYYLIGFEVAGIIHIYLLYKVFRKSYPGFQLIRSNTGDVK